MEVRRMWNRILKHAKKQTIKPEFYIHPAKTSLQNEGITFKQRKTNRIHCLQPCSQRTAKRSTSYRRKLISEKAFGYWK